MPGLTPAWTAPGDWAALSRGVQAIGSPGIPGTVCVFGTEAFPVVVDARNNVVVGAARFGKGRVVLWGHNGYLSAAALADEDTGTLFLNAVRWAGRKNNPSVGVLGKGDLVLYLTTHGVTAKSTTLADFAGVEVIVGELNTVSPALRRRLVAWVEHGGGIVTGATGWGWRQLHPGKDLRTDFAANQVLAPMGLVFAAGMTRDSVTGGFALTKPPSPLLNASHALAAFLAHADKKRTLNDADLKRVGATLSTALQNVPPADRLFLPTLNQVLAERHVKPVPSPKHPITNKDVLARLVLAQQVREALTAPPEKVKALPAAAVFPGASPPGTPTLTRTVRVDTSVPGWHSTGLYADPGALLTVTLPEGAAGKKLRVRIGSTTCRLWNKSKWVRAPEITREFALRKPVTKAANAFGGLVYVVVPTDCLLGTLPVTIAGGVAAPYYVLGKTTVPEWQTKIRNLPAPWAELASRKAVLTVPAKTIRTLADPEPLLQTWDRILDYEAELAQRPFARKRPQRYSADIQLCAGWMHAGNPIMIPTVTAPHLVDRIHLIRDGDWGFFHETGHMHQSPDWTFGGTGEVTVNLFTMYVFDRLCAIPPEKGRMAQEGMRKQYVKYFTDGPDFNTWKSRPFLALYMYYQLQQAFGWDAYKRVFAEYRALPPDEHPKTDAEKRDQWLVRFSRAVGRNLSPFFQAWAVPTSKKARDSLTDLPVWMPADFPPKPTG